MGVALYRLAWDDTNFIVVYMQDGSLGGTLQKIHQGTRHGVASALCQTMMAWGIVEL